MKIPTSKLVPSGVLRGRKTPLQRLVEPVADTFKSAAANVAAVTAPSASTLKSGLAIVGGLAVVTAGSSFVTGLRRRGVGSERAQ